MIYGSRRCNRERQAGVSRRFRVNVLARVRPFWFFAYFVGAAG